MHLGLETRQASAIATLSQVAPHELYRENATDPERPEQERAGERLPERETLDPPDENVVPMGAAR